MKHKVAASASIVPADDDADPIGGPPGGWIQWQQVQNGRNRWQPVQSRDARITATVALPVWSSADGQWTGWEAKTKALQDDLYGCNITPI